MSTIELTGVTKHFGGFTAVKDVSLAVSAGEVVCLLGPSGCGKTTTLRIIAGLERASSGEVIIAGRRMNNLKPEQRENIMFPLYRERLSAAAVKARVAKVAELLHLQGVLDRQPGEISEGEKQRV